MDDERIVWVARREQDALRDSGATVVAATQAEYLDASFAQPLIEAYQRVSGSLDEQTAIRVAAHETLMLTDSAVAFVALREGARLRVVAAWGCDGEIACGSGWHLDPDESLAASAIRLRKPARSTDGLHGDGNIPDDRRFDPRWKYLAVPLGSMDEPLGAMVVGDPTDVLFRQFRVAIAEILAAEAALAVRAARQHQHSVEIAMRLEQERMAQSLHDSVAQSVFAIGMKADEVLSSYPVSDEARQAVLDIKEIARETNDEIRSAVFAQSREGHAARPNLVEMVSVEVGRHTRRGGVPVTLMTGGHIPEDLPDNVAKAMVLVLCEALANVRKHAHARGAVVSLSFDDGFATISVRDNGVGMTDESVVGTTFGFHFGLANLMQLTKRLGGEFMAQNNEDDPGVIVRARFPMTHQERR